MKKLFLAIILSISLCGCVNRLGEPTVNEYVNAIVKEIGATEYNYYFTKLEPKSENKYICDFFTWEPSYSHSIWVCGGTKGHVDCDLLRIER